MLFALGLEVRVVAVSHECDFPPAAAQKPRATRSLIDASQDSSAIDDQVRELAARGAALYEIDAPLLAELAPDLIVTQAQCDVCAVRYDDVLHLVGSQPRLAATRVLALSPLSLADVLADVRRVGEAAGIDEAARAYAASLGERVARIQSVSAALPAAARPRVVCLEWLDPLMPAGNWTPELVELAGGKSGLAQSGRHSVVAQWADVLAYDPQVLVLMPCGFDLARTVVEAARLPGLPGWGDLAAVCRSRVFAVDGNAYFNRSGPRLVDSLEILAHLLHPDLFAPPLAAAERTRAWRPFVD